MLHPHTDTRTALLAALLAERFDRDAITAEQWITPTTVAGEVERQRIVAEHPEPLDLCMERRRDLGRATYPDSARGRRAA